MPTDPEGEIVTAGSAERATFGQVFALSEFRALWAAQMLSVAGDQLARVALTWLVYERTHSALLAAVTFVASIVPTFVGGIVLSGLGDRLPRRRVMIASDIDVTAFGAFRSNRRSFFRSCESGGFRTTGKSRRPAH